MSRYAVIAAALLALSGIAHGVWTHRWELWSAPAVQAKSDRIEQLPLRFGDWEGRRVETDALTLPEEKVGRGVSAEYVNRIDGTAVTVFLTCGPTDGLVSHTPRVCYPANGYTCPTADLRVSPPVVEGAGAPEFWVSNFSKLDALSTTHLRVFWSWSDGSGWQVPGNARRTFRRHAAIYKCYVIRPVVTPDEPLDGDPGVRFLSTFLPQLDAALSAAN